ncbi:MAG TPA: hypothetical protein PLR51_06265, partial [Methanomassiliicoccales archaeon]|nr:hypothetical protein [Methanomassiliicoccales archaeon]
MSENDSRPRGHKGPEHGPRMAGKPKSFKTAWKKMLGYMRPYLPALIIASVLVIIGTTFTVIGPDKLKEMTDLISAPLDIE